MEDNKKPEINPFKKWLTPKKLYLALLVVLLSIKIIFDFSGFRGLLSETFDFLLSVISYILVGFVIAYVLNAYMVLWEKKILKKWENQRKKRAVSIVISYITLLLFITVLLFAIVPLLTETLMNLAGDIPGYFKKANDLYSDIINNGRFNLPDKVIETLKNGMGSLQGFVEEYINASNITNLVTKVFTATASGVFNTVMGIIVSVYMLIEKDKAIEAIKKIIAAIFNRESSERIFSGGHKVNIIFKQYFAGKLLQALIMMIVSYVAFLIAGLEYAILFAFIMGITNMIPYIGPWLGGVPIVLMCLVSDPWKGIAALICVIIAQSVDNWFVTPKIVGGKIGISPLLVLIGLCVGGTMFGLPGMIMGDVMAAVFKIFFYDSFIAGKIKSKVDSHELDDAYLIDTESQPDSQPDIGKVKAAMRTVKKWFGKMKRTKKK